MSHFDTVVRYLKLVEAFAPDEIRRQDLLHPEFVQTELPNLLNRQGQRSGLEDCLRRLGQAKGLLASQRFEISGHAASGDRIYVEAVWEGRIAIAAGPFRPGQALRASFCMAFELRDGKIYRQRNYDCFDPFD